MIESLAKTALAVSGRPFEGCRSLAFSLETPTQPVPQNASTPFPKVVFLNSSLTTFRIGKQSAPA